MSLGNDLTLHGYPAAGVQGWLDANYRKCPTCRGTGINPVWMTKVCPKCDGERYIPSGPGRPRRPQPAKAAQPQ